TTRGVLLYSKNESVGIVDSTSVGKKCQELLGVGGDIPIRASVLDFRELDPRADTLLVGTTSVGGAITAEMREQIVHALKLGWDIWSGMHVFLNDDSELVDLARHRGARLWDV